MNRALALFAALPLACIALAVAGCAPTAREAFGARLDRAQARGLPLLVYALGVPGVIAVGSDKTAVPVYVQFVVTADKPLRSVRFTLVGYTKRGVAVRADNGRIEAVVMTGPGPFEPGGNYEVNSFEASPAGFPGADVGCVEPMQIVIRYANGKTRTYNVRTLRALLLPDLRRHCTDHGPPVYRMSGAA